MPSILYPMLIVGALFGLDPSYCLLDQEAPVVPRVAFIHLCMLSGVQLWYRP